MEGIFWVYQLFIHTETVDKLPRPVELVMNTPSHHRVHHGSDPEYLDADYGGIFIVWDRLFGTFVEEHRRPRDGLTKPVDTDNVFRLQYGEYAAMIADVRAARGLRGARPRRRPARLAAHREPARPAALTRGAGSGWGRCVHLPHPIPPPA